MSGLKVFLSYRRDDFHTLAPGLVRGVHDRLMLHYGAGHVFMDIEAIPPGANFVTYIGSWVEKADVLLAVIGPQWTEIMEQRRDDPRDFVRIEIEAALRRGIPVVPVLMGGARMPAARSLPEGLADLVNLNAVTLDHGKDFNLHMDRLVRDLDRHYGGAVEPPASLSPPAPVKDRRFINSLGMPFVPVPGASCWFGQWPVRVQDYAKFAGEASGVDGSWKNVEYEGHKQGADHPVVNVSWEDARAFCWWLSQKEGKRYRLPTDHEWSLAVGIGDQEDANARPSEKDMEIEDVYPWGSAWPPLSGAGNYAGKEAKAILSDVIDGYRDNHPFTSPVGSYAANPYGLYDLGGNVWEWCEDKFEPSSSSRVLRGASWSDDYPDCLLSSYRYGGGPTGRRYGVGFRCVVEVGER